MLNRQQVAQLYPLPLMNPLLYLQRLLFSLVLPLELLDMLFDGFLLLFLVIEGKVYWRSYVTLSNISDLLLTHFGLGADVVEDVVNDLEGQAEVLTYSKTLYLELWVMWIAQYRHGPESIGHKRRRLIIRLIHIIRHNPLQHITIRRHLILRQRLYNLSRS